MARASRTPQGEEPEQPATTADTGHATASGGASAVTGYRGPAPGAGQGPWGPVRLSRTGDATATGGATAVTGYVHSLTVQQRPPQEPAPWPHQVGVIPPAARSYQHRAESHSLRATADGGGTTVLTQLLTGMGGVGKTQLAADYARAAWSDTSTEGGLDVLVWIAASDRSSIVTGYAQAGIELCRADPSDLEQAARSFLAWLTPKAAAKPCRWLIVLDDVTDPDDLKGLWPPTSLHGRTLVTTRRRDAALAADGRHTIQVGLFTQDEALAYLTTSLAGHGERADELSALAADLGHLPLALAQAAAYIVDAGVTVSGYRTLLADRTTTLAALAPDALPDDQALPLAAAWSLSIDRADTLRPVGLARPMLQLVSLLDGNGIPQDVLTSWPALTYLVIHRADPERVPRWKLWPFRRQAPLIFVDTGEMIGAHRVLYGLSLVEDTPTITHQAVRFHRASPERVPRWKLWPFRRQAPLIFVDTGEMIGALRVLHRLSLVEHTPTTPHQAVRVHRLIQRATRDTLTPRQHRQTARTAAEALLATWPENERDTDLAQALRANTAALTQCAMDTLCQPDAHRVLYRMGTSLGESGQVAAARDYHQGLTEATRRCLGPDHSATLWARSNLASWQGEAGDASGAAEAFADLLADQIWVLGEDHPDTLAVRGNLASWQGEAGDVSGAAEAFADLLADQIRVLGEDHPDTLITRSNLASWQAAAGDRPRAVKAFVELLEHMVRVLGEDHPDTLATRNHLASLRGKAGDVSGATAAFAELLEHMVRVLGEDHPDTLSIRGFLAFYRGKAGDVSGSAEAFADLLADRVRVLGEDHPDTLATRSYLASSWGAAGEVPRATAAFADLLADQIRLPGEDHPDTLATRGHLAFARGDMGDAAGAAQAYKQLFVARRRLLGENHPHTFAAWGSFAHWLGQTGDAAGAVTANEQLLERMVQVLGGDHPHVPVVRRNLAHWRNQAT
ncbi:tetratricopeptide repeat protein [Streptomyces sp. CC224B]|uniref:tetratricopeptide repeat protein n=1 Tax=Streptomyces sp. CC224B TaxID=3044571 RepID=UPI0024A83203|nr:tetratricopeptide repeat protein [Streptomyces sp. CC224B]